MSEVFPNLFSPLKVGKYTLKNRIVNTGQRNLPDFPDLADWQIQSQIKVK